MPQEDAKRLQALERENRVLRKKLERALKNQGRLEEVNAHNSTFLHSVIVEMQEKEAELVRNNDALVAATSAKSVFLANMSHELRTPLNAVIGYAEFLQEDPVMNQGASHELSAILRASLGLLQLINDILDLTKIESGRFEMEERPFSLEKLLADLQVTMAPSAQSRGNHLVIHCDPLPHRMIADELRCRQVLLNLVSNALKFTKDGVVTVEVTCAEQLEIRVTDTGLGMSADQLPRIFEAFTQADSSTTRKFGGTGLGLSISRRLSELMGGSLHVTSELGKGSTFTFLVPAHFEVVHSEWQDRQSDPGRT